MEETPRGDGPGPENQFRELHDRPTPEIDSQRLWERIETRLTPRAVPLWRRLLGLGGASAAAGAAGAPRLAYGLATLAVLVAVWLTWTLMSGGGDVWWSVTPIASRVEAFDTDRARVSVWVVQVISSDVDPQLGGDAVAPTVDFRTTVIDLVWDADVGWSIWNTSSTAGPVPMMSTTSTMSAPTEFMDALGDFTLLKEHS